MFCSYGNNMVNRISAKYVVVNCCYGNNNNAWNQLLRHSLLIFVWGVSKLRNKTKWQMKRNGSRTHGNCKSAHLSTCLTSVEAT